MQEKIKRAVQASFTKKNVTEILLICLGSIILAGGIYFFKLPNNFSTGGASSLGVILGKAFPVFSSNTYVIIINMASLVVGFIFLGKGMGAKTIFCMVFYSAVLQLFEVIYPMSEPFTDQTMLELLFAVALPAIGIAIIFNAGASSGGTDIIAMIVRKYTDMDIGKALLVCNVLITLSTFLLFDMEKGLYSVMGLAIKSLVIDSVVEGFNFKKSFTVVTSRPHEICEFINENLHRGATMLQGVGVYTGSDRWVIIAAMNRRQALLLRNFIRQTDKSAFIMVSNSSEIFGKGFHSV